MSSRLPFAAVRLNKWRVPKLISTILPKSPLLETNPNRSENGVLIATNKMVVY
jgi:hypothetical protein